MMTGVGVLIIVLSLFRLGVSPPVPRRDEKPEPVDEPPPSDQLTAQQAQDQEYFRYLTQVITELEKDPSFKEKLKNISDEDIRSGKLAEHMDLVGHNVREKLDEVKRVEVEYQRELLRQKKHHMAGVDRNYWNPIHQNNQNTFEKDDLFKLLSKHNDMMEEQDAKRKQDFKQYELDKEHKRREKMKNMTEKEKNETTQYVLEKRKKKHEKMHEPGHKAQLEEVWEDEDGLDKDSFDPKTFFNLHDKNSDGHLDQFELKTLFLHDIDKVYNESDPETDPMERAEEMERMREHVMKTMDTDKDGLLSMAEFIKETENDDFEKDEEWSPITDEEQYTEEELDEYEKQLEREEQEHHDSDLHEDLHKENHEDELKKETEETLTKEDPPPPPPVEKHHEEDLKVVPQDEKTPNVNTNESHPPIIPDVNQEERKEPSPPAKEENMKKDDPSSSQQETANDDQSTSEEGKVKEPESGIIKEKQPHDDNERKIIENETDHDLKQNDVEKHPKAADGNPQPVAEDKTGKPEGAADVNLKPVVEDNTGKPEGAVDVNLKPVVIKPSDKEEKVVDVKQDHPPSEHVAQAKDEVVHVETNPEHVAR